MDWRAGRSKSEVFFLTAVYGDWSVEHWWNGRKYSLCSSRNPPLQLIRPVVANELEQMSFFLLDVREVNSYTLTSS